MTFKEAVDCFAYGDDKQRVLWRGRIHRLISKGLIKPEIRYDPIYNSGYRLIAYMRITIIDDEDVEYIDWLYNEAPAERRREILETDYEIHYAMNKRFISRKDVEKYYEKELGV